MGGVRKEPLPHALAEAIAAASVVTFDIFDTALVRAVENPADLFLLLAHEAGLPDGGGFARARVAAERLARQRAWASRRAAEVTLAEIYAVLAECPEAAALDLHALMLRERELELRVCQRHPVIGLAYERARQLGKRVGFISDMYLDAPLIAAMLDKCGYADHDFLEVSSVSGKTKASGELYAHVRDRHALDSARHLHIGDNWHADIQQAIAAGLKTYHIRKNAAHLPETPVGKRLKRRRITPASPDSDMGREAGYGIWPSLWRGLAASHTARQSQGFWHDLGYTHVGMLLLGFGLWLERMARETGVSHLYFLARDGHIMFRVHQMLRDRGLVQTPGSYLYASRRAWNVPALMDIDEQACDFLASGTSRLTVGEFLSRVGLDVEGALPLIQAAGFRDPGQRVRNGRDYGRLRALFRSLAPALLEQAREERAILANHWGQEQVFEQSHIGLVDIGWHGSLQDSFLKLMARFGHDTPVTGFYLGTYAAATARVAAGARQFAFLCEGGEPAGRLATIRRSVELFEWLFCAPHGSVLGFQRETDGRIQPRLESGDLEAVREATATAMQAGALQFIQEALACFAPGVTPPPIPAGLGISLLDELLRRPTADEATLLGELPHAEGFGGVAKVRLIAKPPARVYHLLAWPSLIRGYRYAFWRKGYQRRLWPDCW